MSRIQINTYLAKLADPKRSTLEALRRAILIVIPEAEECISYGMPAFRIEGQVVAGFGAFATHLSYFPHSEMVLPALGEELGAYKCSKGTLKFSIDKPLPATLVRKLIAARKRELLNPGYLR